jgi:hypothetical protein
LPHSSLSDARSDGQPLFRSTVAMLTQFAKKWPVRPGREQQQHHANGANTLIEREDSPD